MRFVVDAQLPELLAARLTALGHDALHVKALPRAGETSDAEIATFADDDDRIVVTKNADFGDSHLLRGTPRRLLRIATGNVANPALLALVEHHLDAIEQAFTTADHLELTWSTLVVHSSRRP